MNIQLPNKTNGQPAEVLTKKGQVTIIGANGSGKSRFCRRLMEQCHGKAYRMSVLRALYSNVAIDDVLPGSISEMFDTLNKSNPLVTSNAQTEFDKLTHIMLNEEFRDIMNYKAHRLMGEDIVFPKTKLDTTVRMWLQVFPKNRVLRENGKILFSTEGQNDKYTSLRLSAGERAVLYYIGAVQYAMRDAVIFVDDPETFIHPSIMKTLWNVIEQMRPDCTFIYSTHDIEFASSRIDNQCIWVKSYNPEATTWDYEVLASSSNLSDEIYFDIVGGRKPVLFVEGDDTHSIDSRLYPLIFPEYTIKPLGSCNKVIEAVRSFNDLNALHHLDSWGIVDRDRRDEKEVAYLRRRKILVPNVAEIENMLMLEGVIRAVARARKKREDEVFSKVRKSVFDMFSRELRNQALMHVRHRVKHDVETRIDQRFRSINALEEHMIDLVTEINPRGVYEDLCRQFHSYIKNQEYHSILKVFNHKVMLGESNVATLCGFKSKDDYVRGILNILKAGGTDADDIRLSIRQCFGVTDSLISENNVNPQ